MPQSTTHEKPKPTTKNGAVELLRILAITCILFHHYQQLSGVYFPGGINFYNGRFPFQYLVELFFLLSGFLAHRYERQIRDGLSFGTYLKGRIARLFPGMIAADLFCYAFLAFYFRQYGSYWMDIPINKWRLLVTLLGMGAGWFTPATQINSPTWYISVLFLCLLLLYLLTRLAQKTGKDTGIFCAGMILLGVAGWEFILRAGPECPTIPFWNIYSARGYYAFFMGVLLAKLKERGIPVSVQIVWLAAGCGTLLWYLLAPGLLLSRINVVLALVIFPPFLLLLVSDRALGASGTWKGIVRLGKLSYSVYLWHVPFFLAAFTILLQKGIYVDLKKPVWMLCYALLSWGVGCAAFYLLEMPLRKICAAVGKVSKKDN